MVRPRQLGRQVIVYRPAIAADRCYLSEVLLWAAFGRFPEEVRLPNADMDWRFSAEAREDFSAPHPGGPFLTPEECDFAGIDPDPVGQALANGVDLLQPDSYPYVLAFLADRYGKDSINYRVQAHAYEFSKHLHLRRVEWKESFRQHVDQFELELLLHLRRGKLTARGTKLPLLGREKVWTYLIEHGKDLRDFAVVEIPEQTWTSDAVNWEESSLTNSREDYVWIFFDTDDVLELFPPKRELRPNAEGIIPAGVNGASHAVSVDDIAPKGRPPLPWDLFHVEVARLFQINQIPAKKEAAIAYFMKWFKDCLGQDVSRSSIGSKLKPYFDQLIRKDKNLGM